MPREAAARMTWEELEAAGVCDCGLWLDGHPSLGRRAQGRGPAPSGAFNPRTVLPPPPAPAPLTARQAEVLRVAWATPTRREAGRVLQCTGQAVGEILAVVARKGHAVPPVHR